MNLLTLDDQYRRMPWDAVDAVVFDVGNVLLRFSPEALLAELFPGDASLRDRLMARTFRSPYWVMLDRGTLAGQAAEDAMTGFDESLRPAVRQLLTRRLDLTEVVEEGLAMLHACLRRGKRTYVLSNYSCDGFARAKALHAFLGLFDGYVISAEEDLVKPDPAIFARTAERFALTPARTLFIDDSAANIEAAMRAGWQGFCLNEAGKLRAFMAEEDEKV